MFKKSYPVLPIWLLAVVALVNAAEERPPNVLLITIDTLRADHLGCYGYSEIETPNLDQLATESAVFEHAIAPVPLTLPSHASILTGVYPTYHGIRDNAGFVLPENQLTLAEILSDAGYVTGAFVGSFVLDSRFGLDQGFDTYYANFDLTGMDTVGATHIQRKAEEVEAKAVEWIRSQHSKQRPFFCWTHFYDPHVPYDPPEPFAARYRTRPYDGEIAYVDSVLGHLIQFLKDSSLYESTIIIITGDHGESLGDHGESTHGYYIYEATQHVPLIWRSIEPRFSPRRIGGSIRLIDIAPTLLQQLGIRPPKSMQGSGALRALMGNKQPYLESYAESYFPRLQFGWSELRAIYRHPYKYIEAPKPELYNLVEDPNETQNLVTSSQSMANSLRATLMDLITRNTSSSVESEVELDSETAEALASLGYIALSTPDGVADRSYQDLPDPKDKIQIYNQVSDANALIGEGKFQQAERSLTAVLRADPSATFANHALGTVYSKMGDHRRAVGAFEKAAAAYPRNALIRFNMGSSYLRLRDWAKAEEAFGKVLEIDPSHFRARGNLTTLWMQKGRFQEALTASEQILEKHENYEVALFNAGLASAALGLPMKALGYLERAERVNPENPLTLEYLAQIYGQMGSRQKAQEYLARARKLREKGRAR